MDGWWTDRTTEIAAALCIAAAAMILFSPEGGQGDGPALAGLTAQTISLEEKAAWEKALAEVRLLVDGNGDPDPLLSRLKNRYPGRHEVWSLAARHYEASGSSDEAVLAYGRAVRLHADYLYGRSPDYLGDRIGRLTGKVRAGLMKEKGQRSLTVPEKDLLKTIYFIERRLAGGCE